MSLGVQTHIEDRHRGGVGEPREIGKLLVGEITRMLVEEQGDAKAVVADHEWHQALDLQAIGCNVVLGAGGRCSDCVLPAGVRVQDEAAGFDGIDPAVVRIAQNNRGGGAAGCPAQLGAQQPQLSAKVALRGELSTEVDEGAQAAVLVPQRGEIGFGLNGHGWVGRV